MKRMFDGAQKRVSTVPCFVSVLFVLGLLQPARVDASSPTTSNEQPSYVATVWDDMTYVFSLPSRWDTDDSLWLCGDVGAIVGTAALLDKPVRQYVDDHASASRDKAAENIQKFGAEYAFGVMAAFYAEGSLADNETAVAVAKDGLASSIIAAGIITPAIKFATGRSRPIQDAGDFTFNPFSGDASFPSGHTTEAFALASSIAGHYDDVWIDVASYGMATMVGLSRIEKKAHFASDIVGAAIVGISVGKTVVHRNAHSEHAVAVAPLLGPDLLGVGLSVSF